jgi:hypothetical protein
MGVHNVEVLSHGRAHLQQILDIVLTDPSVNGGRVYDTAVYGWKVKDGALIFGYSNDGNQAFPAAMTRHTLAPIIEAWLGDQTYPPEPPFDGNSVKGYLIKSLRSYEGIMSVQPDWVHYGK